MDNYAVIDYYNFMGNYTAMDTYVAVMDNKTYSDLSTRYYNFPSDFKLYLTASVVVLSMVIIMALIVLIFHIVKYLEEKSELRTRPADKLAAPISPCSGTRSWTSFRTLDRLGSNFIVWNLESMSLTNFN